MQQQSPIILHVDMNSYFASVEQQANPLLRGKPIAVVGGLKKRTVILAASIEAKRLGVKTAMRIGEALALCPALTLVPADGDKYLTVHEQFVRILETYTERIEVFSVDEAFLDLGQDAKTWEDAVQIAQDIKRRFRDEIGERILCSMGIAPNKLLAKLGSDLRKPDGLTVIKPEDVPALLQKTPVEDLCGIGPRLSASLGRLGIQTVEDLGGYPETLLRAKFGLLGHLLHEMGEGRGSSFVRPIFAPDEVKSLGHSYTLPRNTTSAAEIRQILLWLSERVGRRLRRRRLEGNVLAVTLRQEDFSHVHAARRIPSHVSDGLDIFREAQRILAGLQWTKPIRLVGVAVSGLREEVKQLSFFRDEERRRALARALDEINDRFGDWAILRALMLPAIASRAAVGGFAPHERRFDQRR